MAQMVMKPPFMARDNGSGAGARQDVSRRPARPRTSGYRYLPQLDLPLRERLSPAELRRAGVGAHPMIPPVTRKRTAAFGTRL
jgi:hypothetical protein